MADVLRPEWITETVAGWNRMQLPLNCSILHARVVFLPKTSWENPPTTIFLIHIGFLESDIAVLLTVPKIRWQDDEISPCSHCHHLEWHSWLGRASTRFSKASSVPRSGRNSVYLGTFDSAEQCTILDKWSVFSYADMTDDDTAAACIAVDDITLFSWLEATMLYSDDSTTVEADLPDLLS